jgi:transposase, IS5 family
VQPKNVTFPTDASSTGREKLVTLANKPGVELRQSYVHQRYAHARQFGRAKKALRKLKTYLGRVVRDIARTPSLSPPCLITSARSAGRSGANSSAP